MMQIEEPAPWAPRRARVDVVVPVYNEVHNLEPSIRRLRSYLDSAFPFESVITIADNASTDGTWILASRLASELIGVQAIHLDAKGRGRALRAAWSTSNADIVAYMDVDLSTDLDALLPLVAPLLSGHSDVAIGTRLARQSRVVRGVKREVISRIYNAILRLILRNKFSDAQCGFKALRAEDARALLPAIVDNEWFFDTELLVLAERNGLRIHEVPVDWSDDPDSRVHIATTAIADLRGVSRLVREFSSGGGRIDALYARHRRDELSEIARFASVGLLSTIVYLALYLTLRSWLSAYLANVTALGLCSIGNIAAHLRITFARHGPISRWATLVGASLTFLTSAVLTSVGLATSAAIDRSSLPAEVAALLAGNALAGFVRFVLFRAVIFRGHLRTQASAAAAASTSLPTTHLDGGRLLSTPRVPKEG
jgi:putative flippase GtrA